MPDSGLRFVDLDDSLNVSDDTCWDLLNVGPRPDEPPGGEAFKDERPLGERILGAVSNYVSTNAEFHRIFFTDLLLQT